MTYRKRYLIGAGLAALGTTYLLLTRDEEYAPLATVPAVDLNRYAGKWYEIAAFPQRFQRGCHCTTADYKVNPEGYVEVFNVCRKNKPTGKLKNIRGKAMPVAGSQNSKLKVQFFWPFTGDYWILALAEDYSYALVGTPDRKSLWILSRRPVLDPNIYQRLVQNAAAKGFNVNQLQLTDQRCN
jgi:apolipoprotein D and lipocalin family protein